MADRVAQPPSGTGVNARYSTAIFLYNALNADKNEIGNVSSSTGTKGSNVTGADGDYRLFGSTDAPMSWGSITLPTGNYTVVLLMAFPASSIGYSQQFGMAGGGGVRFECQTTGGGVYGKFTNTGSGGGTERIVGVGGFDSQMWVIIGSYDGTNIYFDFTDGSGTTTSYSEASGYTSPGGSQIDLGSTSIGQGFYGAMVVPSYIGTTERAIISANGWAIYAEASAASTAGQRRSLLGIG